MRDRVRHVNADGYAARILSAAGHGNKPDRQHQTGADQTTELHFYTRERAYPTYDIDRDLFR